MRYLIKFSYDGSNFFGYQKQKNRRTIQGELERVLCIIAKKNVFVSASGRTDALVHAYEQCAHFDLENIIEPNCLKKGMNSLLPDDIYIKEVSFVHKNFHARFDVVKKEYCYKINMGEFNPIERNYIYQLNHSLNLDKINESLKFFKGEHNFKSFTKSTNEIDNYVRIIYDILIDVSNDIVTITFIGNGFLRYMVRNIVGTLIFIGEGKIEPNCVKTILEYEDRKKAYKTAPANGLYLKKVYYE